MLCSTLLALLLATGDPAVGPGTPAVAAPGGLAGANAAPKHLIELAGYVIAGGRWIQEDPTLLQVGRNNGFTLADARLEITARPLETVWAYLSFDGAVPLSSGNDALDGRRVVDLKDAYAVWAPGHHLRVQGGQFKAPQNLEALLEETELRFPRRSVLSEGLAPPAGYAAEGLSLGRQLGFGIGTDQIPLPFGFIVAQGAITNGNGPNQLANDTQAPSFTGRVALTFGDRLLSLGADAYLQPRAFGQRPNLFREDRTGFGADLLLEWKGLHALLLYQKRTTQHVTAGGPDESASGFSVEGAYRFFFLEAALRYSELDPGSLVANARVTELTGALNFYAAEPLRLSLALNHRGEEPGRTLENDSFELAGQVRF